jgi:hypothetical protein
VEVSAAPSPSVVSFEGRQRAYQSAQLRSAPNPKQRRERPVSTTPAFTPPLAPFQPPLNYCAIQSFPRMPSEPPISLPSTRELLSGLISQLAAVEPTVQPSLEGTAGAPGGGALLTNLPPHERQLLLTLHCLLPSTLLPALDLLDRGLVTRYTLASESPKPDQDTKPNATGTAKQRVYYVRSSPKTSGGITSSKFSTSATSRCYEVRTRAWNCTCASFAFAACNAPQNSSSHSKDSSAEMSLWGALSLGDAAPPVCKHLVACVLVEQCRLFERFVVEETVDRNRMAELAVVGD